MLSVMAKGMVTAVGFNATASCTAIHAGISAVEDFYLSEYTGCPTLLKAAKVKLPQWWDHINKLVDLVAPAIYECLHKVPNHLHQHIPILLGICLPETQLIKGYDDLLLHIAKRLSIKLHPASKILPYGQTSGIVAIKIANELLTNSQIPYCIIAGVDSYLFKKQLQHYLAHHRIFTEKNSNGFIPGEAGAAVLLSNKNSHPGSLMFIEGVAIKEETTSIYDGSPPFTASGMTNAIRQALDMAGITLDKIHRRFSDINGEAYKFKEANIATSRFNDKTHAVKHDICHPIEYTGEIGAAIVPLLLGLALSYRENGYHQGDYSLIHASNDDYQRGVLVLRY